MSDKQQFRVVAQAPEGDLALVRECQQALTREFGLTGGVLTSRFRQEGICLLVVLTVDHAMEAAWRAEALGAGYRVVDGRGQVVAQARGTGVRQAPEVVEPEEPQPEVVEPEVTEPEVVEPEVTEPEVVEPEVAEPEVVEPEMAEPEVVELEEPPGTVEPVEPQPDAAMASQLEGADQLIMLDGSPAHSESLPGDSADSEPDPAPHSVGADLISSLAPGEEFDPTTLPVSLGAPRPPAGEPSSPPDAPQVQLLDTAPHPNPEELPAPRLVDNHEMPLSLPGVGELSDPTPTQPRGVNARSSRPNTRPTRRISARLEPVRPPGARLVLGLVLALGLGAVVPGIYSGWAYFARVRPLQVKLELIRASSPPPTAAPGVDVEAVDRELFEVLSTHLLIAVVLWGLISLVVGTMWFRRR